MHFVYRSYEMWPGIPYESRHHVGGAVALLNLGEASLHFDEGAIWSGGHVAVGKRAAKFWIWLRKLQSERFS